jgi:hypothetical protein
MTIKKDISQENSLNLQEQAEIELALTTAIPKNVYYHNLIIALTNMLVYTVNEAYKNVRRTKI